MLINLQSFYSPFSLVATLWKLPYVDTCLWDPWISRIPTLHYWVMLEVAASLWTPYSRRLLAGSKDSSLLVGSSISTELLKRQLGCVAAVCNCTSWKVFLWTGLLYDRHPEKPQGKTETFPSQEEWQFNPFSATPTSCCARYISKFHPLRTPNWCSQMANSDLLLDLADRNALNPSIDQEVLNMQATLRLGNALSSQS